MNPIRSVLWIGRGEHFESELVADAPSLDVVWEGDLERGLSLPLAAFDALVIDAEEVAAALGGLRRLRRRGSVPPALVRVPAADAPRIPELLEAGAADVVLRGAQGSGETARDELHERLARLAGDVAGKPRARRVRPGSGCFAPGIVGSSAPMREVFALVDCASRSPATVLLSGETGTGKELIARAIHARSARRDAAFVAVNCGAFPEPLLESELFGHLRGSFTGAERDKKGLFEEAHCGTLFLDEVSETSGPFQAKLLRALQEGEIRPLGSARPRRVDVRVIAASNRDLWNEARSGRFREDVYYRLAVFPIHVPPLRERAEDLLALVDHFLELHGRRQRRPPSALSTEAARLLQSYHWPGNVRELENEIQRALALARPGETLTPDHFSERLSTLLAPIEANLQPGETLRETLARIEAWLIRRALEAQGGSRTETARRLSITREGLYKKMKRYGIR